MKEIYRDLLCFEIEPVYLFLWKFVYLSFFEFHPVDLEVLLPSLAQLEWPGRL